MLPLNELIYFIIQLIKAIIKVNFPITAWSAIIGVESIYSAAIARIGYFVMIGFTYLFVAFGYIAYPVFVALYLLQIGAVIVWIIRI